MVKAGMLGVEMGFFLEVEYGGRRGVEGFDV